MTRETVIIASVQYRGVKFKAADIFGNVIYTLD